MTILKIESILNLQGPVSSLEQKFLIAEQALVRANRDRGSDR